MKEGRKLYLKAATAIITALYLWFIVLDFSRLSSLDYSYDIFPSGILKRLNVLLASIIAWTVGWDGLSQQDSRRMKWAFVFACLGEAAFAFRLWIAGLAMFAVCQLLLILRNSTGLSRSLKHSTGIRKKNLLLSGIMIAIMFITGLLLSRALTGLNSIVFAVLIYWSILNISLFSGFSCVILELLPRKNAAMAAAGVACFYCCDILVGLDSLLEPGLPWLLANSFIWIFYIPALVLLSLSCFKYS